MINEQLFLQLKSKNLEYQILEAFANIQEETPNIGRFFSFITELYKYHPPEKIHWNFLCFITKQSLNSISSKKIIHRNDILKSFSPANSVVIIVDDNNCVLCNQEELDLNKVLLLYKWENQIEEIHANNRAINITNPDSCSYSVFANATLKDLDEALEKYYLNRVRYSVCPDVKKCWIAPEKLRFSPKPEDAMQESLFRYLKDVLRGDPEINREQNVDDKNPIDIKVTWRGVAAIALIEIKWLGISFNTITKKITKEFSQQRAIDGGEQLQGYLSMARKEHCEIYYEGFLVIFDGRRNGIRDFNNKPSVEEAEHFRDKEIDFPEKMKNDSTLKLDYRFYIEPEIKCS